MYIRFGFTDLYVSRLCQGTAFRHLPRGEDSRSEAVLRHAIDMGINFFDTAVAYGWGGAERLLGRVVAGCRNRLVLCTKIPALHAPASDTKPDKPLRKAVFTRTYLVEQLEASLKRLKTDCIDLCLLHQPDGVTRPGELAENMETLVRSGKIRYWGASNFEAKEVEILNSAVGFAGLEDYYNIAGMSLDEQGRSRTTRLEAEMFPLIRAGGMGLLAFSPMDTGHLAVGREPAPDTPLVALIRDLDAVAGELEVTRAQVCVAWTLAHPEVTCVLAGSESAAQVDDNLSGTQLVLPDVALERLNRASRVFREEHTTASA
ncbi:MAG: aldo/keto reductase [candidate division Zixibacteria bacterium]|nr:aldo/keto reductase [candidate division Zixibacteria bacterium]